MNEKYMIFYDKKRSGEQKAFSETQQNATKPQQNTTKRNKIPEKRFLQHGQSRYGQYTVESGR